MDFEKLNCLYNEQSNDLKAVAAGQTIQSKHTNLNSSGWLSPQDANAHARTPWFYLPCPSRRSHAPL